MKVLIAAFTPKHHRLRVLTVSLCFLTGLAAAQDPAMFDPHWRDCRDDQDCIVVRGACGGPECVNKKFTEQASQLYARIGAHMRCSSPKSERKTAGVCKENKCRCQPQAKESGDLKVQ